LIKITARDNSVVNGYLQGHVLSIPTKFDVFGRTASLQESVMTFSLNHGKDKHCEGKVSHSFQK